MTTCVSRSFTIIVICQHNQTEWEPTGDLSESLESDEGIGCPVKHGIGQRVCSSKRRDGEWIWNDNEDFTKPEGSG